MHNFEIITTLPFIKYASSIFAQRKPNGQLRLLVDLRKIKTPISDDYINNNNSVSTPTDAAQHLAGKKLVCRLDCSQAYRVLQLADQKSVQLLVFNFANHCHLSQASAVSSRPIKPQDSEIYLFLISKNPGNPDKHTPIQKRILRDLQALQDLETLDLTKDAEYRKNSQQTLTGKTQLLHLMK